MSIHLIAFVALGGIWLQYLLKQVGTLFTLHVFNVCWCTLIVYSTLANKQHMALGFVVGVVLGLCITMLFLHTLRKLRIA